MAQEELRSKYGEVLYESDSRECHWVFCERGFYALTHGGQYIET